MRTISSFGGIKRQMHAVIADLDCHPAADGLDLRGIREAIRSGTIKGLYVVQEDLAADPEWREVLSQLDFLVVQDILPSETTKLAHVVLPGTSFAEKEGTFTNYQTSCAAHPPGAETLRAQQTGLGDLLRSG